MRAIVVYDIEKFRENLIQDLNEFCPEIEVIGTADGVVSAAKEIKSKNPDVVFFRYRNQWRNSL